MKIELLEPVVYLSQRWSALCEILFGPRIHRKSTARTSENERTASASVGPLTVPVHVPHTGPSRLAMHIGRAM